MPLYTCNSKPGTIPAEAKHKIASDVTRIHCDVTGAPAKFVHVFFFEDAPMPPLGDKQAMLYGQIRHGRTDEQKAQICAKMKASVCAHARLGDEAVHAFTTDTPASWVMEGGDILPEPGDEEAWLAAHEAKLAGENAT
ncbi:tautomerase family protein [Erythrobacter sp. THAF29]|uniref:tautomerase family protein n=1 Tax=Erythrobacter sp. THAF29 TaxID=2587851 RepID=UPI00126803CF|nr:tautomerase family protein [Erythrobacter sp. THAF29]QFT78753.1 4-oxalocrotonate tautomerase [Erythrobacter sp. THAF29]